jgi:hypothetical protein
MPEPLVSRKLLKCGPRSLGSTSWAGGVVCGGELQAVLPVEKMRETVSR